MISLWECLQGEVCLVKEGCFLFSVCGTYAPQHGHMVCTPAQVLLETFLVRGYSVLTASSDPPVNYNDGVAVHNAIEKREGFISSGLSPCMSMFFLPELWQRGITILPL